MSFNEIKVVKEGTNRAVYLRNILIGDIYAEVDGYYVFEPNIKHGGYWPQWLLQFLCEKLDELNKEVDAIIQKELSGGFLHD